MSSGSRGMKSLTYSASNAVSTSLSPVMTTSCVCRVKGLKTVVRARLLVEESGGGVELGFEIGIGAAAGGVRGALVEEGPESRPAFGTIEA